MPRPFAFGILILTCSQYASAQRIADTTRDRSTATIIARYYSNALGEQSPLYNGKEYIEYAFNLQEGILSLKRLHLIDTKISCIPQNRHISATSLKPKL